MRPSLLSFALCLALPGTALAHGEGPAPGPLPATPADVAATEFDPIVVTATRTTRAVSDVPNTVDVIDRERMDEILARDLKDLFRYEPGITVTSGFGRFGIGDIRIRGLDGNRVRIQTDGIPVSDAFLIGSFSDANRDFVDLDTLKRVEVVRGPTSSLYGSDALGGTVSFITKDPSDYLQDDRDAWFGLRFGHEGDWNGLSAGAIAVFGGERWSGMAALNHRQGQEPENQGASGGEGSNRTRPNPQDREGRSLLAKLVFAPSTDQRFRLTVEGGEDSAETQMLTSHGPQPLTRATNLLVTGDDHQSRARVSFGYEMDEIAAGFADSLDWQAYRQDSETTQDTTEVRQTGAGVNERREREFNFDQRLYGLQLNLRKEFNTGFARHALAYWFDASRTDTRQKRDGRVQDLDTGAVSNAMLPDIFPVRDFPVSRTTTVALYLQDEISFAEDAFRLIPAVRVDRYQLRPEVDPIFADDNPGVVVADLERTSVSPKLGAVWHFTAEWSLYGGYARGFRSPPYGDVNIGFTNVMFGYTAIANPDLKPETSDGLELGVRYLGDAVYASLSGYDNRYHHFIESFAFVGFNDEGLMVFQSRNVSDARIRGVEFRGGIDFGALSPAMDGWSLRAAAAWARGDNRTDDEPLASVDPLTATLGVAYRKDTWGAELAGRYAGRHDRLPPLDGGAYFETPGYGVLDLLVHWKLAPGAEVNAGVFNLTDRRYFDIGSMGLVNQGSATLDRYTAAGRNLSLSVAFAW